MLSSGKPTKRFVFTATVGFFRLAFYLPVSIQCTQRWGAALLPSDSGEPCANEDRPAGGKRGPETEKPREENEMKHNIAIAIAAAALAAGAATLEVQPLPGPATADREVSATHALPAAGPDGHLPP